jgi:hypothetical protein
VRKLAVLFFGKRILVDVDCSKNSDFFDRILPFQSFESGEIGIAAMQGAIMLDCQGGKMSIGHQVSDTSTIAKHALKNCPMMIARLNDSNTRLVQPALHPLNRCG